MTAPSLVESTARSEHAGALRAHADSAHTAEVAFALDIAEAAGRLVMDRYERELAISHKSARDVVTEVDHLSEALVIEAIRARFPGDGILAEESGAHHAIPGKEGAPDRGRTWVIDPIDGTINYANGIPFFCVAIGLVVDGRPSVGAVHDPSRNETFLATADGPATLAGQVIRVSDKERLSDFVVQLAIGGRAVATRMKNVRKAIRVTRNMGSAALGLSYVANARFDAFVQSGGMSAWDVAAAGLIAERAGARVTAMDGGPWFELDRKPKAFGALAAPPNHHAELLRLAG